MYKNGEETQFAMNTIFAEAPDAWEEHLFENTEYAMKLDKENTVLNGVLKYLGFGDMTNEEDILKAVVKELNKRYKKMCKESTPRVVRNWLKGELPNPSYRENLYDLCLALELDLDETKEFFLKFYLTIPFNYKNRIDAIYYYGFTHNLCYSDIHSLLDEELIRDSTGDEKDKTIEIGANIADIDDIDKFKECLKQHTYSKEKQFNTAAEEIEKLFDKNAVQAEIERKIRDSCKEPYQRSFISNTAGLLTWIYRYSPQKVKTSIKKAEDLPLKFRQDFPEINEFQSIQNRIASPNIYRKALIIMKFYDFFSDNLINSIYGTLTPNDTSIMLMNIYEYNKRPSEEIKADAKDFFSETSNLLALCGFEQMYPRNPFDWLILYCANSNDPLETFRELLDNRFVDKYPE